VTVIRENGVGNSVPETPRLGPAFYTLRERRYDLDAVGDHGRVSGSDLPATLSMPTIYSSDFAHGRESTVIYSMLGWAPSGL
jgi:hypothetical protein